MAVRSFAAFSHSITCFISAGVLPRHVIYGGFAYVAVIGNILCFEAVMVVHVVKCFFGNQFVAADISFHPREHAAEKFIKQSYCFSVDGRVL